MISVLILSAIGGCHQQAVVQKQVVQQVVAQQVAYVPAYVVQPLVQTYGVVDPYWTPRDNSAERIEKLLALAEQQALTIEKLTAPQKQTTCDDCDKSQSGGGEISRAATSIIQANCAGCHDGNNPKTAFDVTKPISREDMMKVAIKVDLGEMPPPPRDMLSEDDILMLKVWANGKGASRDSLRSK